jgi:uncharacterized protein YecT (DUF1311 family)
MVSYSDADCKDTDLKCAPYKKMDSAERQLAALNRKLLTLAFRTFATYDADDLGYNDDLKKFFTEADRSWRSYRDAQCLVAFYLQGMSRKDIPDLAEECRLDKTRERIREVNSFLPFFTANKELDERLKKEKNEKERQHGK